MPHHRDPGADDALDDLGILGAALQLHGLDAAFSRQADGVLHRLVRAALVAAEGHVADEVRPLHAALHGRAVIDHLVHGDR